SERGLFEIGDVILAITTKLIRRHPHVFGQEAATSAGGAKAKWEKIKADERASRAAARATEPSSILDDVPGALPALARAEKLSKRAASVDFDWPDWRQTLAKIEEELDEVRTAAEDGNSQKCMEEIGDLLFAVANLSRKLAVDP